MCAGSRWSAARLVHAAYFGVGALEALRVGFRTAAEKSAYLDELLSLAGAGPRARNQASR